MVNIKIKKTTKEDSQLFYQLRNNVINRKFFLNSKNISFNEIFIIELKSDSFSNRSPLVNLLKDLKIESVSFSKYCIGMALTEKKIKKNNFKAMLLKLNKIMEN